MIWRDQSYNLHEVGEQGVSQSRGRDECVDGSIGSGPKYCYGVKSEEELAGLENWLWRVSRQGKKTGHSVQRHGAMGNDMHQKPTERVVAIRCWGWVGLGSGIYARGDSWKASTVLGCDTPIWLHISLSC